MRTCSGMETCVNKHASVRRRWALFFYKYLFALRRGRMVPIVGQVASEDVELAWNHPPRVSHLHLILRR